MRKFVVFALICVMAFAVVSFAKTEATVDPSGKCDAMYYSNTDVFGDIVRTIPSGPPPASAAWIGMVYANGELLQFQNVATPAGVSMFRKDPNTGAIIATVVLTAMNGAYAMDVDFDGTNIWIAQWNPSGIIKCLALDGSLVSSFVPAVTGSPRAINFDMATGNLWVGTNVSSNNTWLYEMTSTGTVLNSWNTGAVVGWYMGFVQALDAPPGSQHCLVDNVGNTIKRLQI
ncbi:MAG: hypothetical protein NTW14_12550, partial [bacterium]|nr:hypothetical protein [bacterium]